MTAMRAQGAARAATEMPLDTPARAVAGPLQNASLDRLSCLMRHWTWTDEARQRLERELVEGWEYEDAPFADHPFGSYYHWCALLCGFGEAALEGDLLSSSEMDQIRADLYASLPALRACRQLLLVIPSKLEAQLPVVDLIRSDDALGRLRRLHVAFGEALTRERMAREVESLDQ